MDIQLEKIRIIQRIAEVDEEWLIKSFKQLLGITDDDFIKNYEANLKPMTKEELIKRALAAEEDYKNGRFVDLEEYFNSIEK